MKKICSLMCGILLIYMCFIIVYSDNKHSDFKYIQNTENMSFTYDISKCPYNRPIEIRNELNDLFKTNSYTYREVNNLANPAMTNLVYRVITVDKSYVKVSASYTFILAHELSHLRYCVANETWTNYTAVISLYESNNPWFKNVALWYAEYLINSQLGDEYDCGWYLVNYFEKEAKSNESLC